ncbi:MAG: thymidine phosphorylase [Brevirhabdus sp.]
MDARRILSDLRHGKALSEEQIAWFCNGLASDEVSAAQAGAFAMAVCRNGMSMDGRVALTRAMRDSGEVLKWDLPGPTMDKHSTGGLGDCVSLILAPVLAACGGYVPMISGRGLGHTGGTLDKLEAIPGYNPNVDEPTFRRVVANAGAAIVSAGPRLAPADRVLYAVRDVTGTVDSIDLITASILSKKLAEGCDALLLDVKTGAGAFLTSRDEARELARSLTATANGAGCRARALLTDMDQPLAPVLGNALEVAVCVEVLTGSAAYPRLAELTTALCGELLEMSALAPDAEAGERTARQAIASGAAAERFGRMVAELGGPRDFVEKWRIYLPTAPITRTVKAPAAGFVIGFAGHALGLTVVDLGGGRRVSSDTIDLSVGLSDVVRLGAQVEAGDPIAVVHAASESDADAAEAAVLASVSIDMTPPADTPLILERITT